MKLQDYREKRAKLGRAAAAAQLGVNPTTIWRWETGRADPLPKQIGRITAWSKGKVTANDFWGAKA